MGGSPAWLLAEGLTAPHTKPQIWKDLGKECGYDMWNKEC
jgi:hypothetical protein